MTTVLKLVSKKDKTVLAEERVAEADGGTEEAKNRVWKRMMRQLKLMWIEEEVDAS